MSRRIWNGLVHAFIVTIATSCGSGMSAEDLCALIEAESDCTANECVTVACFDSAQGSQDRWVEGCSQFSRSGRDFTFVDGERAVATGSTVVETCYETGRFVAETCGDSGYAADVYVSCASTK